MHFESMSVYAIYGLKKKINESRTRKMAHYLKVLACKAADPGSVPKSRTRSGTLILSTHAHTHSKIK